MNQLFFMLLILITCFEKAGAQKRYFTKTAVIEFLSKAPLEDIHAINRTATGVVDTQTGVIQFSVLMKGFVFKKALMQEHFNDNYVESHKFPKAAFKGSIVNKNSINFESEGKYPVRVTGQLTLHGITKSIEVNVMVHVANEQVAIESTFNILLSDYKIKIPAVVRDKLSNTIHIAVSGKMQPL